MRALGAMAAAFLMAWAVPATGRADAPGPGGAAAASQPATPGCKCPGVQKRRAVRPRRVVRHHRHWRPPPVAMVLLPALPPVYYNPAIPGPYDTAYDRALVLHFRSPPVSGFYRPDPGFPPTPPVAGIHYYRVHPGPVALQYDGLIGEYVQLAHDHPAHQFAAAAAPPPNHPPH